MVFNPEEVTLLWNGKVITGYSEDSKISAERNEDAVAPKTGVQGDTVYSYNANRSGTVKFSLFGSSASLAGLRRDAQARKPGALTLRNANDDGGFIVSHSDCRILKVPPFVAGKESDACEVSIYVPLMVFRD